MIDQPWVLRPIEQQIWFGERLFGSFEIEASGSEHLRIELGSGKVGCGRHICCDHHHLRLQNFGGPKVNLPLSSSPAEGVHRCVGPNRTCCDALGDTSCHRFNPFQRKNGVSLGEHFPNPLEAIGTHVKRSV